MKLNACARCTLDKLFNGSQPRGPHLGTISRRTLSAVVGAVPAVVGAGLGQLSLQGGIWTALRMRELIRLRHETVRSFLAEVDHVVAVCQWVKDVLVRNGVDTERVTLCRQGVAEQANSPAVQSQPAVTYRKPLKVVFMGRLDPTKGVHILIRALRSSPGLDATLAIYGVAQDEAAKHYEQELHRAAAGDDRISFHPPVPNRNV